MRLSARKKITHKRLTVGDIGISYLIREAESGEKAKLTVIYLHGFPFNKNMWNVQLEALPPHVTGIAVDIRGHGNSTSGHGFFSIDLFAHDLLEFMRKMEIEQAILCGVSMGGYIALRAHEIAPEKIQGLILSDTNSLSDNNEGKLKRFETIKSVLKHGNRPFSISFGERVFSKHSLENNPDAVELIRSAIRRNNVRAICATLLALASRTDTTESLKQISVPTLLVWGAEDVVTPVAQSEVFRKNIPHAKYVEIEKCGHLPSLENPSAFNEAMLELFDQYTTSIEDH